jgi:hypothetical protein
MVNQNLASKIAQSALIDSLAILFVYFTPSISQWLHFPIYLLDPMRIMVMIGLMHSHRNNAIVLAILLPVFSYIISSHPYLIKTSLISIELLINIFLFLALTKKLHVFGAMFLAIVASKIVYYGLKIAVVKLNWLQMENISTPLWIQLIMALVFALYAWLVWPKKSNYLNKL